jgi:N-acetylneuraminic acid mutarotase
MLSVALLFILSCSKSKSPTESNGNDSTPEPIAGWTEKSSMPTARLGAGACTLGDKIFVFCGTDGETVLFSVEEYDLNTDSWTVKSQIPTGRVFPAVGGVDNKVYVIGGTQGMFFDSILSTVEEYNTATDSWTTKTQMPTPRATAVSAVINGKIYVITGRNGFKVDTYFYPKTNAVEMYDTGTNIWTAKAPIPTPRVHVSGAEVNGKIYVIGGESSAKQEIVEAYDPVTDSWSQKANVPDGGRFGAAATVLNGKIYVIGGSIGSANVGTSSVFEYNPTSDVWKQLADIPIAVTELIAITLNDKIYIIGGGTGEFPYNPSSGVYEYDPLLYLTD